MRRLSKIKSDVRLAKCYICKETFINDLLHLSTVNKSCPNGCCCVLEWIN